MAVKGTGADNVLLCLIILDEELERATCVKCFRSKCLCFDSLEDLGKSNWYVKDRMR